MIISIKVLRDNNNVASNINSQELEVFNYFVLVDRKFTFMIVYMYYVTTTMQLQYSNSQDCLYIGHMSNKRPLKSVIKEEVTTVKVCQCPCHKDCTSIKGLCGLPVPRINRISQKNKDQTAQELMRPRVIQILVQFNEDIVSITHSI